MMQNTTNIFKQLEIIPNCMAQSSLKNRSKTQRNKMTKTSEHTPLIDLQTSLATEIIRQLKQTQNCIDNRNQKIQRKLQAPKKQKLK